MALFKRLRGVVCVDENDSQVRVVEGGVDVQHEVFAAARQTDGRPRFAVLY